MADLELATREELIAELGNRFDTFIFAGKYEQGDAYAFRFRSTGCYASRLGLCDLMKREVRRDIPPSSEPADNG